MKSPIAPPRHIRGFLWSRRVLELAWGASDALVQGLWLGVLDANGLQDVTNYHYHSTRTEKVRDENYFSEKYNTRGLFGWERVAVDAHFGNCTTMLVGAAGGGREAFALAQRGMKVDAFECNPDLVESCRSFLAARGVAATVTVANPNEVPASLGVYDGAVLGWGSYMHIVGREMRIGFLKDLHRHLQTGAPVLISVFAYKDSRRRRVAYRTATIIRRLRGAAPVERGDALSSTFEHYFTKEEVEQEMASAGFELVDFTTRTFSYAVVRALPR